MGYGEEDLLRELRHQNVQRARKWHNGMARWSGADWSNAMCGEAGEAANVVKKIRRLETSAKLVERKDKALAEPLIAALADELADTLIYADLLADHYGIDLRKAVRAKFNRVSDERGFSEYI